MKNNYSVKEAEARLELLLSGYVSPCLALSGGIDSLWLYHFWRGLEIPVLPVFFDHPGVYPEEREEAEIWLRRDRGLRLFFSREEMRRVWAGPAEQRCYRCKNYFFSRLRALTGAAATLCDGSHLDDQPERRPGMRALAELGVVSPLRLSGWHKEMIREAAKAAGILAWERPARACMVVNGELEI